MMKIRHTDVSANSKISTTHVKWLVWMHAWRTFGCASATAQLRVNGTNETRMRRVMRVIEVRINRSVRSASGPETRTGVLRQW